MQLAPTPRLPVVPPMSPPLLPFAITRRAVLHGHRDCVYALAAGAPGTLFSAGADGLVVAWNLAAPDPDATGELVAQLALTPGTGGIYAVRWRTALDHLLVGHNGAGIHVVDLATRAVVRAPALGPAPIFEIALSETLGRAWAALGDGTLAELDLATYAVRRTVRLSHLSLRTLAVAESRGELIVAGSDHRVRVLDADSLRVKHELVAHTNSIFSALFTSSGTSRVTTAPAPTMDLAPIRTPRMIIAPAPIQASFSIVTGRAPSSISFGCPRVAISANCLCRRTGFKGWVSESNTFTL